MNIGYTYCWKARRDLSFWGTMTVTCLPSVIQHYPVTTCRTLTDTVLRIQWQTGKHGA